MNKWEDEAYFSLVVLGLSRIPYRHVHVIVYRCHFKEITDHIIAYYNVD